MKGQIGLIPLIGAGATILLAAVSGFFYQSNRIGAVETQTAVLEVQYTEVNKKLDRIELKLDQLNVFFGKQTSLK